MRYSMSSREKEIRIIVSFYQRTAVADTTFFWMVWCTLAQIRDECECLNAYNRSSVTDISIAAVYFLNTI